MLPPVPLPETRMQPINFLNTSRFEWNSAKRTLLVFCLDGDRKAIASSGFPRQKRSCAPTCGRSHESIAILQVLPESVIVVVFVPALAAPLVSIRIPPTLFFVPAALAHLG